MILPNLQGSDRSICYLFTTKLKREFGKLGGKYEETQGFNLGNRDITGYTYGLANRKSPEGRSRVALIGKAYICPLFIK
jgi:hypothetical protein